MYYDIHKAIVNNRVAICPVRDGILGKISSLTGLGLW